MADRTIRTIYEAKVSGAEQALRSLSGKAQTAARTADSLADSLRRAGDVKVNPRIDADIKTAESQVRTLTKNLERLESQPASAKVTADITQAKADLGKAQAELKALQGAKAEMVVRADADLDALGRAKSELKTLDGAKAEMVVTVDSGQVKDALGGVSDAAAAEGEKAGTSAGETLIDGFNSTPIVGAVVAVLAAAGIAGVAAFKKGLESDLREDRFGAMTGLDEATASKYGRAAGEAYSNAWGDSMQDNMDAAQVARENMLIFDDMTQADLQKGIEQLQAVADITGGDVAMSARAAGAMIKNNLAGSATEAYDLIVKGTQNGLNYSDDFLDTLEEYSPMFASLGLSGTDAMALLEQSMKDGARSTDFAADAIKELSIRAQDGSDTTAAAYAAMGLNADDMAQKMAAGGEGAREGMQQILDGIQAIEDPMARNAAGVALFGTKWEDLGNGANLASLELDNLGDSWDGAAGSAEDAMQRMSDNNATQIEGAWRSITSAVEQVAGALATALGPQLQSMSEYVSQNRGEIMQWVVDSVNGFFEMARAAVDFGGTMIEISGTVAGGMAGIVEAAGKVTMAYAIATGNVELMKTAADMTSTADSMRDWADTSDTAAQVFRDSVGGAVDSTQEKFNEWAGPAVMQAKLADATTAMYGQMDEFSAYIDTVGGTVQINGSPMNAETALNALVEQVNLSDGTVTINGQKYPAEEALAGLQEQINLSGGTVTIDGNKAPADQKTLEAVQNANASRGVFALDADGQSARIKHQQALLEVNQSKGTMGIDADDSNAEGVRNSALGRINQSTGTLNIAGNDADARGKLNELTRPRYGSVIINAAVTGLTGKLRSFFGLAHGGMVNPMGPRITRGLATGGYVPGSTPLPGTDNVLWPLARGGQVLAQPLAGGEFVTNPVATAMWGPMLEWMNNGGKPSDLQGGGAAVDAGAIASAVRSGVQGMRVDMVFEGRVMQGYMTSINRRFDRT